MVTKYIGYSFSPGILKSCKFLSARGRGDSVMDCSEEFNSCVNGSARLTGGIAASFDCSTIWGVPGSCLSVGCAG